MCYLLDRRRSPERRLRSSSRRAFRGGTGRPAGEGGPAVTARDDILRQIKATRAAKSHYAREASRKGS